MIALKLEATERAELPTVDIQFFEEQYHRLRAELASEAARSALPDNPDCFAEIDDLLLRIRRTQASAEWAS